MTKHLIMRWVARCAALAMLAVGAVVLAPGTAHAAGYNGGCGAGYKVVRSMHTGGGSPSGSSYLTYNSSNGYNCVVTIRDGSGSAIPLYAMVQNANTGAKSSDFGWYGKYAGPVYVYGRGSCVNWAGGVGEASLGENNVACG
jgi:hypothetical protein